VQRRAALESPAATAKTYNGYNPRRGAGKKAVVSTQLSTETAGGTEVLMEHPMEKV